MSDEIRHIVILGGGTAGWLTAGIIAADHGAYHPDSICITLIESPDVPILGVGEGTWPSMRDTLRRIGVDEREVLRRCGASFKQGSRFDSWRDGTPDDRYAHPFSAPPSPDEVDTVALWRAAPEGTPFASAVSPQVALADAARAPKQATTPPYAAVLNYAYHLNATAFAAVLRDHCVNKLGVHRVAGHVQAVEGTGDGRIAGLVLKEGERINAELFVDCSGQRAVLIDGFYGAKRRDVSSVLFNDRALAAPVPYESVDADISSWTVATAIGAGWIWDIGLQSRRGVGLVHSSHFLNEDEAHAAFIDYAQCTNSETPEPRLLTFQSGYRENPWQGNCVAVGMAQGFVEPLEASAIVMVELSAQMISDILPRRTEQLASTARMFNARFAQRWSAIVDFLKFHYILSQRTEPYWRAHRDKSTWTDRVVDLMDRWTYRAPSREDFTQTQEIFPASSYAYILYGMMDHRPDAPPAHRAADPRHVTAVYNSMQDKAGRLWAGLPTNRALLQQIAPCEAAVALAPTGASA
ncbi:tryptophan halogenase family protein [Parvularcula sp. LCG005]|uniref:tryptophan halogenase family protein n=1 Tax=Parvularcula sp. LCG005 TaxID=3078805 RepID=UPI00294352A1|nr:tryptophan halogenase family protein [Parvularcula sp. LCG005]WOI52658.1 tryptophan halogenase family protein [Parvularcula sp. LCG005]